MIKTKSIESHNNTILLDIVKQSPDSCLNILISGEKGTGKEAVVRALYEQSHLSGRPFIKIDCSALTDNAVENFFLKNNKESENPDLFSGGFPAMFQDAILYFHKIDKMSPGLQSILTGKLKSKTAGGNRSQKDQKGSWIFATSIQPVEHSVNDGFFSIELFNLMSAVSIHMPPIRKDPDRIPKLIFYFLNKYSDRFGNNIIAKPSRRQLTAMVKYSWPGNIRELQETVKRALASGDWDNTIELAVYGKGIGVDLPIAELDFNSLSLLPDLELKQGKFLECLLAQSEMEEVGLMDLVIYDEVVKQSALE